VSIHSLAPRLARLAILPLVLLLASRASADIDARWTGAWLGDVKSPAGGPDGALEMQVALDIARGEPLPAVLVTSLRAGAVNKAAADIAGDGRTLAFTLDSQGRRARFEGELSEDGGTVAGSFAFLLPDGTLSAPSYRWSMRRVDRVTDLADAKVYDATLVVGPQKLPMRLSLGKGPNGWCGSIDIAVQGVRGLALSVERSDDGLFRIAMPVGAVARLELRESEDRTALEGVFAQGGFRGPIRFVLAEGAKPAASVRPQDPKPPFPYEDREVRIDHPAGHALAGTLSMPRNAALSREGRVPAVVLVTGSGPQNRDEEILGHRPFAVLADAFARAGVAVLRYDDRGFGASTGSFGGSTAYDFASDADIASEWLKRQAGIDPARVGLVGHSEGAMIAPIVAAWQHEGAAPSNPVAFLVLLAPPVETGGETMTRQTARMYELTGMDPGRSARAVAAHEASMQAIRNFADPTALRPLVEMLVRSQLALQTDGLPPASELDKVVDQTMVQLTSAQMTEFIRLDPRTALARLEAPTLAIWGSKDFQVVAEPNKASLDALVAEHALPVESRVYEGLNHLFQPAVTGLIDEYGAIDTTIDPKVIADLVAWIAQVSSRPAPAQRPLVESDALPRRVWTPSPPEAAK